MRAYLGQFLSDPRVIELPKILWQIILRGIILPFRVPEKVEEYREIWLPEGSPLNVYMQSLSHKLQANYDTEAVRIDYAMNYQEPVIADKLAEFAKNNITNVVFLPLFPQFSAATHGPIWDQLTAFYAKERHLPEIHFIRHYADNPLYIDFVCQRAQAAIKESQEKNLPFRLYLTFHGIPKKYHQKGDPYYCYCSKTARLMREKLGLDESTAPLVFQSRFGKQEWLQPYLEPTLLEHAKNEPEVKAILICPGFSIDCIETTFENGTTNKEVFEQAGGKSFELVECLNDSPDQLALIQNILSPYISQFQKKL